MIVKENGRSRRLGNLRCLVTQQRPASSNPDVHWATLPGKWMGSSPMLKRLQRTSKRSSNKRTSSGYLGSGLDPSRWCYRSAEELAAILVDSGGSPESGGKGVCSSSLLYRFLCPNTSSPSTISRLSLEVDID